MDRIRISQFAKFVVAALPVVFLMLCADFENPFSDSEQARASIENASFNDGDTIEIFHTQTFALSISLQSYIDSIRVHIDANRLWPNPDSVIDRAQLEDGAPSFRFSLYDTGWQSIRVITYRTENDSVVNEMKVYATSPLHQMDIRAKPGETISLSTAPVKDDAIYYVWDLKSDSVRKSEPSAQYVVDYSFSSVFGQLYVEAGGHRSPAVEFRIMSARDDRITIHILNDNSSGDTVYTGDRRFELQLRVTSDNTLTNARINDGDFDTWRTDENGQAILTKIFEDVSAEPNPDHIDIAVQASSGATASIRLFIVYDPSLPRLTDPRIIFTAPNVDSSSVNFHTIKIRGEIQNGEYYEDLALIYSCNNTTDGVQKFNDSSWQANVKLSEGWNTITMYAFENSDYQGDTLAEKSVYVYYDPDKIDTIPPTLIELRYQGKAVSEGMIFDKNTITIAALLYDDAGINPSSVKINQVTADDSSRDHYLYFADIQLPHDINGSWVKVEAADWKRNVMHDSVRVFYNRPPAFTLVELPTRWLAGREEKAKITAADPDKDAISFGAAIALKSGDTLLNVDNDGSFAWTPAEADKGWRTITFTAWDGIESIDTSIAIYIADADDPTIPVRFATRESDFPDSLRPGIDTLSIALAVDERTGTAPFRYQAKIKNGAMLLPLGDENHLTWAPGASDAGVRQLEIIVLDNTAFADTLTVPITVLPAKKAIVSFARTGSAGAESVSEVNIRVVLSEAMPQNVTVAYHIDADATTAGSDDYSLDASGSLEFSPGVIERYITLTIRDDAKTERDERVVLTLGELSDNAALGATTSYIYTIVDDDKVTISFASAASSGNESESCRLTVQLSKAAEFPTEATFSIDTTSSTAHENDYSLPSNTTVTIPAGRTEADIVIDIVDDAVIESNELMVVQLSNPSSHATFGSFRTHTYTINDNENPEAFSVSFASSASSGEENGGQDTIEAVLSQAPRQAVSVDYRIDADQSTAQPGADYELAETGTLNFAPGVQKQLVIITLIDNDHINTTNKRIVLSLQNASEGLSLASPSVHTYTIYDDEEPPVATVSFSSSASSGSEGGARTVDLKLSEPSTVTISVKYVIDTASSTVQSADLSATSGIVYFNAGETRRSFMLPIKDDNEVEDDETVVVRIAEVSAYAQIGAPNTHTFTIEDDDRMLGIAIDPEGSGSVQRTADGVPDDGPYAEGTVVKLQAHPAEGYVFVSYVGDDAGTDSIMEITMDQHKKITANFAIAAPRITSQPSNQVVTEGASATFTVRANGLDPRFQWKRNGGDISGAQSQDYTIGAAAMSDSGVTFTCVVSNAGGSVESAGATLTVTPKTPDAPTITQHPQNDTITEGESATFSVTATGNSLGYQWQKDGVDIGGATGSSYTVSAATLDEDGSIYRCVVSNAGGELTSNSAILTVKEAIPEITVDPRDITVTEGETATFSVTASGSNLSYQWQANGASIEGATSASYTSSAAKLAWDGVRVRCIVSNSAGNDTSAAATLTVIEKAPVITEHPQDVQVNRRETAMLSVTAEGANLAYQWQRSTENSNEFSDMPNQTLTTLTIPNILMPWNNTRVRCLVSNGGGADTSQVARIRVRP